MPARLSNSLRARPPGPPLGTFEVEFQGLERQGRASSPQVTGFSSQVDVLEYPEGGQNDVRAPAADARQAGEYHAQARRCHRTVRCSTGTRRPIVQAEPVTLVITLQDTDMKPVRDLELPQRLPGQVDGRRPQRRRHRDPDRVARDRPQRHDDDGDGGMTYTPPPGAASFVKAKLMIDGGTTLDCYFNPTEYSLSKTQRVEVQARSPARRFTEPEFGGGQPRQMELSLLFDQTLPAVQDDRARGHRRAAGRDGGARRARPAARRPRSRRSSRSSGAR